MQIRRQYSIPVSSTTQNLLQGESIEFASEDSMLTLAAAVPSTSAGDVSLSLRLTDEIVMDRALVGQEQSAGAGPQLPYNVLKSRQPVGRGDHLILSATNTDGAVVGVVQVIIELEPIA
jgi:hypothetical protein